jgi:hypothetical protein
MKHKKIKKTIVFILFYFILDEDKCSYPAALLEFFAIASECWFLCSGVELYQTITNPFSSFKSR